MSKRYWRILTGFGCLLCVLGVFEAGAAEATSAELFSSSFGQESVGEYDRALNDMLQILRRSPDYYAANLRVGWLYYLKGAYADSVRFYQRAAALSPESLEAELGTMLPLMAAGRWADAEKVGLALLKRAPSHYLAGIRLAYVYYMMGDYRSALAQYRSVHALYPSDTDTLLGLGWSCVKLGRNKEAGERFELVLTLSPDNQSAEAGLLASRGEVQGVAFNHQASLSILDMVLPTR